MARMCLATGRLVNRVQGMGRIGLAAGFLLLSFLASARAGEETRDFTISIDGASGGEYHMKITDKDGVVTMRGAADVKVTKYLLYTYKYTYRGTEVWKNGRLQGLSSSSNDNGKEFKVSVAPTRAGLGVKSNGKERTTTEDAWLTTYWRLPDPKLRKGTLPLIDADTGKLMTAKLEKIGSATLTVGDEERKCVHYRLTGGVKVDLWYDAKERLVREEFEEDGHKTVLKLK